VNCRFCGNKLEHIFIDLGHAPPSNAYLTAEQLEQPEITYPLKLFVCDRCWLVQVPAYASAAQVFTPDYAYFSSVSTTWVDHARRYVEMIGTRLELGRDSFVVELASNDGYLLQFVQARGIPCLGIEPTASTAQAARQRGIETIEEFFGEDLGRRLARQRRLADLIVANNVLAHVPDIKDFVSGVRELLAPRGVATFEFPHLMRLVEQTQFDTIYHEHFSYFSLVAVERVFAAAGLTLFDVEELPTHGGSLRIFARHTESDRFPVSPRVGELAARERALGVESAAWYEGFAERVRETKRGLLDFLIRERRAGRTVAGYGAPAKGNTLLNYCGIRTDLLDYTVDRSPHKQGHFLPGTRIPIHAPERIFETKPDYLLILPWNLRREIATQMAGIREWGGRFVVAIPEVEVF